MFVDEKAAGEKEPLKVGTLRLSEAIRIGKETVIQGNERMTFTFCALGCAWAGIKGEEMGFKDLCAMRDSQPSLDWPGRIATTLGFPAELGERVNSLHCRNMSALAIAATLEAEGL